uniref:HEAT repeat-containing protein 5B n=1 Tax=Globodera rostochiensis TaxID=31243 RepID=A0A914GR10_GLORO
MELSHSLVLNEQAYRICPDPQKAMFLYEWLRFLDRILPLTKKADLKDCQQKLLEQLTGRITGGCPPPSRILLGRCIARIFAIADAYNLFLTINTCNDVLKDPSGQNQVKLTALCVLGEMYEKLGRMVGRSYEETFQALAKWMKSAESSARVEIWHTMAKMVQGLGSGAFPIYKEVYKSLAKSLADRVLSVRAAAAKCLVSLVAEPDSPLFAQYDLESMCTLCIKSLNCANCEVRQAIAQVFAKMAARVAMQNMQVLPKMLGQVPSTSSSSTGLSSTTSGSKQLGTLEDILRSLANGMQRGGVGGFLKTAAKTATGFNPRGQRETRIGIAQAYVALAHELGPRWLKRNIPMWFKHMLDLVSKCASEPSSKSIAVSIHSYDPSADVSLCVRRCVLFVLRSTVGQLLSEPDLINACKELGNVLGDLITCFDCVVLDSNKEEERVIGLDVFTSAHACIVCLMEIGSIALQVDTAIVSIFVEASGILEPVFSCLVHPIQSVRIAAAWSLRCVVSAIPSLATPLVDRCLSRLEYLKRSSDAVSGFSLSLGALLPQCSYSNSPLGIPFAKARQVFTAAEDLIKSATQNPRLMLHKVRAGWLMTAAVISMGSAFAKPVLDRLFILWRISFARSVEETKTEKDCGDATTWEATLEARAGALDTMVALVEFCADLCTDETIRRMTVPIETTLGTMGMVGDLLLMHGVRIRPAIQLLRLRLFSLLCRLPVGRFESAVNPLLKELVAEVTLSDNVQSAQKSSLCASVCTSLEGMFLGGWVTSSESAYLETELLGQCQTTVVGSLEFDSAQLVHSRNGHREGTTNKWWWPEPQPLAVAVLDSAIQLFARVFPVVSDRCKLQLLQHFATQLQQTKQNVRLLALQLNILTALCLAAKSIGERRVGKMEDERLQQVATQLVLPLITSEHILLKCLAVECLSRFAQAICTPQFVAGNAQYCFDKIRQLKDECSRQGFALALGVLHRYMGSLGSGQHLNTAVGILLALAQDINCSSMKPWALFSLSLIASTGGGMFCPYAEPVRNLCLQLLLNSPQMSAEIVLSIAKLIFSLISAVGPELSSASGTIESTRQAFLVASSMLLDFEDLLVKAEAIACFQHLHLFSPRHVEIDRLVLTLCEVLHSSSSILRKSTLACIRQLLQQESREVREHVKALMPTAMIEQRQNRLRGHQTGSKMLLSESGLEGALFEMLDTETEPETRQHLKQSLLSLLQAETEERLGFWLSLCREALATTASMPDQDGAVLKSTISVQLGNQTDRVGDGSSTNDEQQENNNASNNDDETLHHMGDERRLRAKVLPRWHTRVFAFDIVQRLLSLCETERAHLDLALAKELLQSSQHRVLEEDQSSDYLVLHLAELVKMGFMGATGENTQLRMAGLDCIQKIITKFAKVAEPEFPGHVLLEQYQAQIGAALRPAFAPETPANVTALACQVASSWICSGVAHELNDIRKIHQLLVSSLAKLTKQSSNTQLYNESASTMEKLAILKAWSKVYICATEQCRNGVSRGDDELWKGKTLLELVEPELATLVELWQNALRDWIADAGGGIFFTLDSMEICKNYYRSAWPLLLLACSVWVRQREDEIGTHQPNPRRIGISGRVPRGMTDQLHLMVGICLEFLCNNRQYSTDDRPTQLCLRALLNLLGCEWVQKEMMRDVRVPIEILNVLYKIVLTRDSVQTHRICVELTTALVLKAANGAIRTEAEKNELDEQNGNDVNGGGREGPFNAKKEDEYEEESLDGSSTETALEDVRPFRGGEGEEGVFDPRHSLVFAVLEVCMCVLTRQIPQINTVQAKSRLLMTPLRGQRGGRLSAESDELIHSVVVLLPHLLNLCCSEGQLVVLPSLLNILLGTIRETSSSFVNPPNPSSKSSFNSISSFPRISSKPANSAIMALRQLCSICPDPQTERVLFESWQSLMCSALLSLLKTADGCRHNDPDVSSVTLLSSVVLLLSAVTAYPSSVSSTPRSPTECPPRLCIGDDLFEQFCDILRHSLHSSCQSVQLKALQAVRLLFQCPSLSALFVRELGNDCFANIRPFVEEEESVDDQNSRKEPSEEDVLLVRESISVIEAILSCARDDRERIFVSLLVRSLAQFLRFDDSLSQMPSRELHEFALERLNAIFSQHSESFKALLQAAPDIRQRIETATIKQKEQQQLKGHRQQPHTINGTGGQQPQRQQQPTIKLATDFSAFANAGSEEGKLSDA